MPYDLLIKNGVLIDGSGQPRHHADIAVRHGRIASIGRIREAAREVIDADGMVVAPGFVDGHTHMDAQIFWDPLGTSSCWHGITSVVMGNCGFTLAPCAEADKAMVVRNLERAEDISGAAMAAGFEDTVGRAQDGGRLRVRIEEVHVDHLIELLRRERLPPHEIAMLEGEVR